MTVDAASCGAGLGAGYVHARYQHQGEGFYSPLTQRWCPAWSIILGVGPDASADEIKRAYHVLAVLNHPDHGGSDKAMASINAAYELAMKSR